LAIATARLDLNLSRLKPSGFAIDCGGVGRGLWRRIVRRYYLHFGFVSHSSCSGWSWIRIRLHAGSGSGFDVGHVALHLVSDFVPASPMPVLVSAFP
jgi:hypothetical protein